MDIVLDNPVAPPPPLPVATAAITAIPQLGLPPHHFAHVCDVSLRRNPPLLPAATEEYYARNRHGPYDGPDGAPASVSARRIDKSGLLEVTETDPATYPRSCALTKDMVGSSRSSSLRVDRTGLLEAVPEDDAPEEHCDGGATTKTSDETVPLKETLKVEADVHSRSSFKFDDSRLLEQPSSLEGQGRSDEIDTWNRSDVKILVGSPRAHLDDVSAVAERLWKRRTELTHLPSSPGSTLRRLRNDPSRASPLISRGADADAARLRSQKSPEFTAKCTVANSASRKLADPSQSPIARDRLQVGCSKDLDPASIDSDDSAFDARALRGESLLAMGNERKTEPSSSEKRVEAEGCEHTVVESVKEKKVSFKGSNKLPDDNVETPRVIILSERL